MLTSPNNLPENWAINADEHDKAQRSIDKGREDALCGKSFFPRYNDANYNNSYSIWKEWSNVQKKKADDWDRSYVKDEPTILGFLMLLAISFIGYTTTSLYHHEHPFIAGLVVIFSCLMSITSLICLIIELIKKVK